MEHTSLSPASAVSELVDQRAPRYTSYPTAPIFSQNVGADFQGECLRSLDPDQPISVYVHIPFCERLCWFCACRTQGTQSLDPLVTYMQALKTEIEEVARHLPDGVRMGRLHWGGGTPTILPPEMIEELAQAIKAAIPPAEAFEFSVEIDPTLVDADKIAALHREGFNRASMGVQDFSPVVQKAIGREQSFEQTKDCIDLARAAGVNSLNIDLVYGLPHQTSASVEQSIESVLGLDPDRIALFGYAHVPWAARRQRLIHEEDLPDDAMRQHLFQTVARRLEGAGYQAVGIDHFAKTDDGLSIAARTGDLHRNFQGYTTDTCQTLVGIGASSISRFPQGYVQNAAATAAYVQRCNEGLLSGYRGHILSKDDLLRARAIELLMCDFAIELKTLDAEFGNQASELAALHKDVAAKFSHWVELDESRLSIRPEGQALTRVIAQEYDAYRQDHTLFSRAS